MHFRNIFNCGSALLTGVLLTACGSNAQVSSYKQTNIVSNVRGVAENIDVRLRNPLGIALLPGQPFFVVDHFRGVARVYDAAGLSELPGSVAIPPSTSNPASSPGPTAVIANTIPAFEVAGGPSQLLFATEQGTIAGWYGFDGDFLTMAITGVDNSLHSAEYEGLAILTPSCCAPFLAATDFHNGFIESFTESFAPLAPPGSFTDPHLPAGYAPFGIQKVGTQVFVTYALQDIDRLTPKAGPGNGIVSIFDQEGNFVKRFASNGNLNAPWAVVQASANFGRFSNVILVGNTGDGTIAAFDPNTGSFLGNLQDVTGKPIINVGLRGMVFGSGGTGDPNTLYFTANPNNGAQSLLGSISVSK